MGCKVTHSHLMQGIGWSAFLIVKDNTTDFLLISLFSVFEIIHVRFKQFIQIKLLAGCTPFLCVRQDNATSMGPEGMGPFPS